MPIQSADLAFRYAVTDGTAGSTRAGSAAGSHGRYVSVTDITDATLENLFPELTGDENAAQNVDYKCLFVLNTHPTLTLQRTVVWVVGEVVGGADVAIALDNVGVVPADQAAQQAATIPDKNTAPTGVTPFSSPVDKTSGFAVGSIPPNHCVAVWVQRRARNTGAQSNDGATLRVEGDTTA